MSFSKEMRKATRDVHSISDALVNSKLLFALSSNAVWAEGLLIFYEIFRFLEIAADEKKESQLSNLLPAETRRTAAFENDLRHYLGENWKSTYAIRDEVASYISHLETLRKDDPYLLLAYGYHLYMGLLSGGQILKKKHQIKSRVVSTSALPTEGYEVTTFGESNISDLKNTIRANMDLIAESLGENQRESLLKESRLVFELNNKIIKTVRGADGAVLEILMRLVFYVVLFILFVYFLSDSIF